MRPVLSPTRRPLLGLLVSAACLAATAAAAQSDVDAGIEAQGAEQRETGIDPLALDTNSLTSDQSINVPTAWWLYTGQTAAQISSLLSSKGARLTELQFESISNGEPRFAARMVKNSGAYAATGGWWWYYGLTTAQVSSYLNANSARLIDIEPYDIGGGTIRYAVVMVSNAGAAARSWTYLIGATSSQISTQVSSNRRIIDLDHFVEGGVKKYAAVFVSNTGTDAKSWQYFYNQTTSSIAAKVSAFAGRIVKLDRQSDGTYNFVQVKNTGADASAWWYQYDFTSGTALLNFANQVAARPVEIQSFLNGSGQRRYTAAFIDNANAATRRMRGIYGQKFLDANGGPTRGIFSAYLKQSGSSVLVNLNADRKAETASALKALHLLHGMRQVQLGTTTLASAFNYYNYPDGGSGQAKDKCPSPIYETSGNLQTNYNFEKGLDEMMRISDNRTTRGVVLRYGMSAINTTGSSNAGMTGTQLRHNIGCAYWNLSTQKYDPDNLRNNTTAADLSRIYEGVWRSTALTETNAARTEFLESANPKSGVSSSLQAIINAEASALGKSAVAASFGTLVKGYSKGGSYGTCLPDSAGACGQKVIVRSSAGLIRLPIKVSGATQYRDYAYGHFISDTPVPCWENFDTSTVECQADTDYTNAFNAAQPELFREVVRSALQTW